MLFRSDGLAGALAARSVPVPFAGWSLTPLRDSGFVNWWRDQPLLSFVENWTDPRWHDRVRYLGDPDRDPIETRGWEYVDQRSYTTNSYARTAVALRTLMGVVGRDKFLLGMRHYSEAWRYRHPYPQDFYDAFCVGAGLDVRWYFDEVFRGTGTLDWSVSVEQRRKPASRGEFQIDAHGPFEPAPKPAGKDDETAPWTAEVLVTRRGELRLPLSIELRFEDGSRERREWTREAQADSKWLRIRLEGEKKLVGVVLDPDRLCYLDADHTNDAWFDERDERAPYRWTERVLQRWLALLHWQAGIGG